MGEDYSHETFVIHNPSGSVSLDPWFGKTREELKIRCGQLSRVVDRWQRIAMILSEHGRDGLSQEQRDELDGLIEAYRD
jgi:hypothetical protein